MKNTFINKVAAERAVLRIINAHTTGTRQLSGLSWTAIDTWQRSSSVMGDQVLVDELREISDLCQRLSDRSHETFSPLDPAINTMIDSRMEVLARLLASRRA
jgi:hypothetical protein